MSYRIGKGYDVHQIKSGEKLILGDTSSLILNNYHPYEALPKLLNPPSGYLFNTNNSPFNSTRCR